MAPLLFTGQAGNRNVQVSVIGMHDIAFHQRGDQVWHLGRDEAITGKSIEIDRRSWAQGLLEVSALSVVVKLNGELGNRFTVKS